MVELEDSFAAATRRLLAEHGESLLRLAVASIEHGLARGRALAVAVDDFPDALRGDGACFVTLKQEGRLRGCIGSPQAYRPLVVDVAENAFSAAFRDPRFPPLTTDELAETDLSLSVLSPQSPIEFTDQAGLLAALRPLVDGLVIADGPRRALFLPQVWEQLPRPEEFLSHLKQKAGLGPDHWSNGFRAWRFVAEEIKAGRPWGVC